MSWHIEKDTGDLVIDGFDKGISSDPYAGLQWAESVNTSVPGEISAGYTLTANATSGATVGRICGKATRFEQYGASGSGGARANASATPLEFFFLDDTGNVFSSTTYNGTFTALTNGATTTGASNQDSIAFYLGFLFKTRGANVDYWDGSTWHNAWQTSLTASTRHYMYVAIDIYLYITNGNYVAAVELFHGGSPVQPENFDPATSTTYTFNTTALRLPVDDNAVSLCEIGYGGSPNTQLLIGGMRNAIYPWDKTSASFSVPIYVADQYIYNMVSANQKVYIFAGYGGVGAMTSGSNGRGRIYVTTGSQAELFFKIPDTIRDASGSFSEPYYAWGDAVYHRNDLVFSFLQQKNSDNSNTPGIWGVFALDLGINAMMQPTAGAFRSVAKILTSVNSGCATAIIDTGILATPGYGVIIGMTESGTSTGGIQYSGTQCGIATTNIYTDIIRVGLVLNKKTFTQVEYRLRSAMQSNEFISISAICDSDGATSYSTNTLTFTPSNTGFSAVAPVNFQGIQWLYFNVALTGDSEKSGCRLYEIRIR